MSLVMIRDMGISLDSFASDTLGDAAGVGSPIFPDPNGDLASPTVPPPLAGAPHASHSVLLARWSDVSNSERCPPHLARWLAEVFVRCGDVLAMSYTSAPAMHSATIRALAGMKQAGMNALIATQRRYEHSFQDRKKMRALDMLLGRCISAYLPSLPIALLLLPLPYALWGNALLITGAPVPLSAAEVEASIRSKWDDDVVPILVDRATAVGNDAAVIRSDALLMTVYTHHPFFSSADDTGEDEKRRESSHSAHSNASSSDNDDVLPSPPLTPQSKMEKQPRIFRTETHQQKKVVACVLFDDDICRSFDVVKFFRLAGGSLTLCECGHDVDMLPYNYRVREGDDQAAVGTVAANAVKSAVTSIKGSLKSFMRSLT
jgi:hypothetical protein